MNQLRVEQAIATMGDSGRQGVDHLFELCVRVLLHLADLVGISYTEVNILLFVVLWPLLTVYLIIRVLWLRSRLQSYSTPHSKH